MSGADGDGVLLVLGSGERHYREYLLAALAGRRPWLLDDAPVDWQLPYLAGHSRLPQLVAARLTSSTRALVRQAELVSAERTVAGVLTYDETLVVPAARLAETLALPGLGVAGAENCRDKERTRAALTRAGVPQPLYGHAATADEAGEIAARIGYPVVVKPRGMAGSIGVVRVDGPAAIDEAVRAADAAGRNGNVRYNGGVLIEELLRGPEISVDGAVCGGRYRPVFLARKTVALAPYFEEVAHTVDGGDRLLGDADLMAVLRATHAALDVRDGMTHTEVILTGGGPVVVEVNARLGGDLIPYLGVLATGVDAAGIAADIAVGCPPSWQCRRRGVVGVRFCYPSADGVLRAVRLPDPGEVPGLVRAERIAPPGAVLRLPPRGHLARYAFVVCEAPDAGRCAEALRAAADRVEADLEPV